MDYGEFTRAMLGDGYRRSLQDCVKKLDGVLSEECSGELHEILRLSDDAGLVGAGTLLRKGIYPGPRHKVNVFPLAASEGEVYPDYIGFTCGSKAHQSTVLESAEAYCWKACKALGPDVEKTVLIITDMWRDMTFRAEFEQDFLRYALQSNVLFLFVMVTQYGVQPIPFLPWDRNELRRLAEAYRDSGGFEADRALQALLDNPVCSYRSGLRERNPDGITHWFDFDKRICRKTSPDGTVLEEVAVSHLDIRRFAESVSGFSDLPLDKYIAEGCDGSAGYKAELFGKTFEWDNADFVFEAIEDAFNDLIWSL